MSACRGIWKLLGGIFEALVGRDHRPELLRLFHGNSTLSQHFASLPALPHHSKIDVTSRSVISSLRFRSLSNKSAPVDVRAAAALGCPKALEPGGELWTMPVLAVRNLLALIKRAELVMLYTPDAQIVHMVE